MENTVLVKDRLAHIADVLARYIAILGLCMVPWSTSLDQLPYVSLLLSLLIGQAISTSGTQIITHRIGQITLLLIAVLSASTLSSVASRHFAWHQWLKYVPKLILFMLLPGLFTEAKHRMQAIHALRNMVCITCILYWAHCHHWINLAKWLHKPSLIEVINPIPFSSIVAYTTMICFDLYRKRGNAMYLLTAAIGLQHLIWMNPKRTGLLAFAVLLAFHCIRNIRLKPHQYWIAAACFIASMGFTCFTIPSLHHLSTVTWHNIIQFYQGKVTTSIGFRLSFIVHSLHLWLEKPIFGHGLGSFLYVYHGPQISQASLLGDPHNTWLHMAIQAGTIGIITWTLWLMSHWEHCKKLHINDRFLAQCLVITFAVSCLCIEGLLRNHMSMFYVILAPILLNYHAKN